jgi:lycopene cyclase domain-containing protein
MTYWLVNIPFLLVAALVCGVAIGRRATPRGLAWVVCALVMMVLTVVFDNAIIGAGVVGYNPALLSGVMVGLAPLEDFSYTLAAVLIIPALWHLLQPQKSELS